MSGNRDVGDIVSKKRREVRTECNRSLRLNYNSNRPGLMSRPPWLLCNVTDIGCYEQKFISYVPLTV